MKIGRWQILILAPIILSFIALIFGNRLVHYYRIQSQTPSDPMLKTSLSEVDRVEIMTTETTVYNLDIKERKVFEFTPTVLFKIEGKENVQRLIEKISIESGQKVNFWNFPETLEGFHCMCSGDFEFLFKRDTDVVANISFHHGKSIRWNDGPWGSDATLAPDAGNEIIDYLEKSGFNDVRSYVTE